MELIDLDGFPRDFGAYYAGDAGPKYGITMDGSTWLVKFPKGTRDGRKRRVSYAATPINEYLGSRIYASLGIPTHEVALGTRAGRVVAACRDFRTSGDVLVEFKSLKNSLPDDQPLVEGTPSDGSGTFIDDVLRAIRTEPTLMATPGVVERFWDMFVVDAFIRNSDRNNTDWGLLINRGRPPRLAPVYDNGGCFFDRRADKTNELGARSASSVEQDAFGTCVSCYTDAGNRHIKPFEYMRETSNDDCRSAVIRFVRRLDMDEVTRVIEGVPARAADADVLPDGTKALYLAILEAHATELGRLAKAFEEERTAAIDRELATERGPMQEGAVRDEFNVRQEMAGAAEAARRDELGVPGTLALTPKEDAR